MKSLKFQKRSKKMLLHKRADHADQKQQPQKINMRVTTSQVWNKRQKSNLLSQNIFVQSIVYPTEKNKFIGTSSILDWGKSRVLPTDPLFILRINVLLNS